MAIRLVVAPLLMMAVSCSAPAQPSAQARANGEVSRLRFIVSEICLPVIEAHLPFDQLIARYQLKKNVSCDIQRCTTLYCTPDQICFAPPSRGSCHLGVSRFDNFDRLNAMILGVLGSDESKWSEVRGVSKRSGYHKAFCNADHTVVVFENGFRPGELLAPALRLADGRAVGKPFYVDITEFDVNVTDVRFPEWCAPL